MNKEEIIFWLKHFAEHPTGFKGYEDDEWKREINLYSVFNYLLELKCKVNQLESAFDEIRAIVSKSLFKTDLVELCRMKNQIEEILDKVGGSNV